MSIVTNLQLKSNNKIKINFDGGDLSSDSGLLLIKEFAEKIGFHKLIKKIFKTNDAAIRDHKDFENLLQVIYQILARYFKGDSGFATPKLFSQCETNGVSYAIRLKANQNLYKHSQSARDLLDELTIDNKLDYKVVYDEFDYQAASWDYPRRVVIKVEKPSNQFNYLYTFIVTNISMTPFQVIKFYSNRGSMENFIKECKIGFNFNSTSSSEKIVNENRLQLHILAYNLFNWFRRLVLAKSMNKMQIDTIRLKLIKIASKVIHSGRYLIFKLCSSCPYKKEFFETFENISKMPQLE